LSAFIAINVLLIIDTTIVRISSFEGGIYPLNDYILFFAGMYSVYAVATVVIMRLVKRNVHVGSSFNTLLIKSFLAGITGAQYVVLVIISIIIFQVITKNVYSLWLLKSVSFNSYLIGAIMLGLLSYKLISWFRRNRSIVLILYFCGMSLICIDSLLVITSLEIQFQSKPEFINYSRNLSGGSSPNTGILELVQQFILIASFCFTWLATLLLMKNYSNKIGMVKYWTIMLFFVVYFVGQFQPFFFNLFLNLSSIIPSLEDIGYSLFIGATRPAAGILFGIVFWFISRSLTKKITKDYLLTAGFGMMLLFASNQPVGLSLTPVPPFSLITAGFFGLAGYLLFVGLYSSAVSASLDSELRNKARKYARQLIFLDKIGTPEMKQHTESMVMNVMKEVKRNVIDLEEESGVTPSIDEDNFKEYLRTVIKEVRKEKNH